VHFGFFLGGCVVMYRDGLSDVGFLRK